MRTIRVYETVKVHYHCSCHGHYDGSEEVDLRLLVLCSRPVMTYDSSCITCSCASPSCRSPPITIITMNITVSLHDLTMPRLPCQLDLRRVIRIRIRILSLPRVASLTRSPHSFVSLHRNKCISCSLDRGSGIEEEWRDVASVNAEAGKIAMLTNVLCWLGRVLSMGSVHLL